VGFVELSEQNKDLVRENNAASLLMFNISRDFCSVNIYQL